MLREYVPIIPESLSPLTLAVRAYRNAQSGCLRTKVLHERNNVFLEMARISGRDVKQTLQKLSTLVNRPIPKAILSQAVTGSKSMAPNALKKVDAAAICRAASEALGMSVVLVDKKEQSFREQQKEPDSDKEHNRILVWTRQAHCEKLALFEASVFDLNKIPAN